jgi:hypothetical protein
MHYPVLRTKLPEEPPIPTYEDGVPNYEQVSETKTKTKKKSKSEVEEAKEEEV